MLYTYSTDDLQIKKSIQNNKKNTIQQNLANETIHEKDIVRSNNYIERHSVSLVQGNKILRRLYHKPEGMINLQRLTLEDAGLASELLQSADTAC